MNYRFLNKFIVRQPALFRKKRFSQTEAYKLFNSSSLVKEAIYLASPELFSRLEKAYIENIVLDDKLFKSLHKYLNRMSWRSTPFGLFATCGIGKWDETTMFNHSNSMQRKSRLDMFYLSELYLHLIKNKSVIRASTYFPNTSLYKLGENYRYIEYSTQHGFRKYQITQVSSSEELEVILQLAKNGAPYYDLALKLFSMGNDEDEIECFIDNCIDSQLLVADFEPSVTCEDNLSKILNTLSKVNDNAVQNFATQLKLANVLLNQLDEKENKKEEYQNLIEKLNISEEFSINEKYAVQVDSYRLNDNFILNKSLQNKIAEAIEVLSLLSEENQNIDLRRFKIEFYRRYGDQFISLVEVLDAESGIGYPLKDEIGFSDLLDSIPLKSNSNNELISKIEINKKNKVLFNLIKEANDKNLQTISITKDELHKLGITSDQDNEPLSISILAKILNDERIFIEGVSGTSAVNIISRFGSGSEEVESLIKEIVNEEESLTENLILSEVLHLPEGRVGNIILHPKYRNNAIYFLSGQGEEHNIIPVTDLEIGIRKNLIILRSKSNNKIIIPRISNAHNYPMHSLPIYHFLGDLQSQMSKRSIFFKWPDFGFLPDFFPQIVVNDVIISPAIWNIPLKSLLDLLEGKIEFRNFAKKHRICNHVIFTSGDNSLFIDLEDINALKMLIEENKKQERVLLSEYLEEAPLIKDHKNNTYSHQFIFPLVRLKPNNEVNLLKTINSDLRPTKVDTVKRKFLPCDEWIYFKIYGGKSTVEYILGNELLAIINYLNNEDLITKWFFIRFEDTGYHFRFRLHLKNSENTQRVLEIVYLYFNSWIKNKLIYNIILDGYERELERYLGTTILDCEELFWHDSKSIINYLSIIAQKNDDRLRWLFAIKSIDSLLTDFRLNLDDKINFISEVSQNFKKEFNVNKATLKQINKKFNLTKKDIHCFITDDIYSENILNERSNGCKESINNILKLYQNNKLSKPLTWLIADFTHMLLNRLFVFNPRYHEMITYEMLLNYYLFVKNTKNRYMLIRH